MEQFIPIVTQTCKKVFLDFVGAEPHAEKSFANVHLHIEDWDISGIIGLTGDVQGVIVLSMKKELAVKIAGMLTGGTQTVFSRGISRDVDDVIGEIVNIISGNTKKSFENSLKIGISLPVVVFGNDYHTHWNGGIHALHENLPERQRGMRSASTMFTIFEKDSFMLSVTIAEK